MTLLDAIAKVLTKDARDAFDKLAVVVAAPSAEIDRWREEMMDAAGRDAEVMNFHQWRAR